MKGNDKMNWKRYPDIWKAHYVQLLIPSIDHSVNIEYEVRSVGNAQEPEYAVYANQKIFDQENWRLIFTSSDIGKAAEYCENHCIEITNQMIDEINELFDQFRDNERLYYSKLGRVVPKQEIKKKVRTVMEEYGI